jgi:phosphoglycerol transferase
MTHPSTFIKDNYVDPSKVDLQFPQKKRNLIYVYLESMEQTYTDPSVGGTHKQNLIPELTKIAQQNESFSNSKTKINGSHSVSGTTFTMGGIFAATSGLPLKTNIKNNEMSDQTSFFDGVTTLGDILKDQGYNQTFMIGSDASFGGRDKYFNSHGNYQIDDYNWAKREKLIDQDYKVFWGYEDEKLFSFAKRQLSSLSKDDKPFNFTMLTVDTHFIDGYKCHLCEDKFPSQYENVMACSSRQVSAFIKWCQSQSWYKDTTIVLSGDHPTMNGGINGNTEWKDRKVYTAYINADAKRETTNNRNYATLDNFPTTLAAMGVKIPGNKLGLGVNLFSKEKTLLEKYSLDHVDEEIKKKSAFMDKLQDVRAKSARQLLKEGQIPLVTIKADPYKRNSETINTYVTKIKNPKNLHITEVLVNASYRQDGAYGMNNVMEKQSDGTYKSTVNVSSILNKFTNKVYVTVYVTTQENGKYKSAQIEVPIK